MSGKGKTRTSARWVTAILFGVFALLMGWAGFSNLGANRNAHIAGSGPVAAGFLAIASIAVVTVVTLIAFADPARERSTGVRRALTFCSGMYALVFAGSVGLYIGGGTSYGHMLLIAVAAAPPMMLSAAIAKRNPAR